MRLSDAMALGPMVAKLNRGQFTLDECEGCAMGVALRATGYRGKLGNMFTVRKYWPWATDAVWFAITKRYFEVVAGTMTFEELLDYVRSVEPAEQEEPQQEALAEQATVGRGL